MRFGTVAKSTVQGKMIRPENAKSNQLFSQCHADIRFMGAAKLPWRRPAITTTTSPPAQFHPLFPPMPLGLLTKRERKGVRGENEPSVQSSSREINGSE